MNQRMITITVLVFIFWGFVGSSWSLLLLVNFMVKITGNAFLLLFQDGRLTFYPESQVVKLPFINFMKAHGTSFLNAYTNSPICCPSRAGMNTLNIARSGLTLKMFSQLKRLYLEFSGGLVVWFRSLLCFRFDPWPRNFCMPQVWPKKILN